MSKQATTWQYWSVLDNFGQWLTILGYIWQYGQYLNVPYNIITLIRYKIELNLSLEQYWTIQDNIGQYWTTPGNIGQYWAILDNIGQYLTIFKFIIHNVTIPQGIFPFYQDLTIYKLFVWPRYPEPCTRPRTSFRSLKICDKICWR